MAPLPHLRGVPRMLAGTLGAALALSLAAGPTLACGGLIGPNGAVNLLRTTTLAAYHDDIEHYVTAFEFAGGGGAFGSIVPLPGVPTDVVRGGDWTLQRLERETEPQVFREAVPAAFGADVSGAQVLLQTRIDALDITVLKGGAAEVGQWATAHSFRLPPDAPEVLDFYAKRSPIFMAAVFDADAAKARGQAIGDGTPVHITIPTTNPWVPLRILALGRLQTERIDADVFLLTDRAPAMLPAPGDGENGLVLSHFAPASDQLLADLRADNGMDWIPDTAWLTKVHIDAAAPQLDFDLAIDASGRGVPSRAAAGLEPETWPLPERSSPIWPALAVLLIAVGSWVSLVEWNRRSLPPAATA